MKIIRLCDVTMKQEKSGASLSFREKIELSKLLDRLGVSVIELEGVSQKKADALRVKSIASAVKHSAVAVPVTLDRENVDAVWTALAEAKTPRLQVPAAMSPVQMEYIYHKKPAAMLEAIRETVAACREKTENVEFIAQDATRADAAFLAEALGAAVEAGATAVTLCDAAGAMLPEEFAAFLEETCAAVPALRAVSLGVSCADTLAMADACAVAAIARGAGEIKVSAYSAETASLQNVAKLLHSRGEAFGADTEIHTYELGRVSGQIERICAGGKNKTSLFDAAVRGADTELTLTVHDSAEAVGAAVKSLGYDLSEEDSAAVYAEFQKLAARKDKIDARELDAIVAAAAMQTPPTYTLKSYLVNNGNIVTSMSAVKLAKDGQETEGVSLGDGPIDASFLAIEQVTGSHYELDDFQIRAVTEGKEAMGETVVRLRSGGKLYSGRGISTDIIGASILAYVNALNKIVYEEAAEG